MRLSDARNAYYEASGKLSDIGRQLALAGFAIIWVFKSDTNGVVQVPPELGAPAFFLALTLALDLLQYVSRTLAWGWFHRITEKREAHPEKDPTVSAPAWLNRPAMSFFVAKLLSLAVAYVQIIGHSIRLAAK